MFSRRRVIAALDALEAAGVRAWIDGGWGVDALLGEEGRIHADLDLVLALDDVGRAREALGRLRYRLAVDLLPTRAVLTDDGGRSIDLHPVSWDGHGTGWQAGAAPDGGPCRYPAEGFTEGLVAGREVGCLTAALQLEHHVGYPPDAVDRSDVARLCRRFGLAWPASFPAPFEGDDVEPEPLAGGNLTGVTKVGPTVRRAVGPWTPAVHALLSHLHAVGYTPAPRVLGVDRQGREVLELLDGAMARPEQCADDVVAGVGRLLRRYHDVVASFRAPAHARWQRMPGTPVGELVTHNDVSSWNVLLRSGTPVGLVDWDLACPATPLWDLAYAAWRFVPLVCDADLVGLGWPAVVDRPRRLRLLTDAYGLDAEGRTSLLGVMADRLRSVHATIRAWGGEDLPGWRELLHDDHAVGGPLRDVRFLQVHAAEWQRALER